MGNEFKTQRKGHKCQIQRKEMMSNTRHVNIRHSYTDKRRAKK